MAGPEGRVASPRLTIPMISLSKAGQVGGDGMLVLVSVLNMAPEEGAEHF